MFNSQNSLTNRYCCLLAIISGHLFGHDLGDYTHFLKRKDWQGCILIGWKVWGNFLKPKYFGHRWGQTLFSSNRQRSEFWLVFLYLKEGIWCFGLEPTASIPFSLLFLSFLWNFRYVAFLAFFEEIPLLQTASRSQCLWKFLTYPPSSTLWFNGNVVYSIGEGGLECCSYRHANTFSAWTYTRHRTQYT